MNWDAVGAIGELVSAVAVLATLIYLAIQVRHNGQQVWSQNMHSATDQFQRIAEIQAHPHVAAAIIKAIDEDNISREEGVYLESYVSTAFSMYANQFDHVHSGINVANWENTRKVIAYFMAVPWIQRWWDEYGNLSFNPDFVKEVEQIVRDVPADLGYIDRISVVEK